MKTICLLVVVVNIVGSGMCLMKARNKKDKTIPMQLAWGSSMAGWTVALIGVLF